MRVAPIALAFFLSACGPRPAAVLPATAGDWTRSGEVRAFSPDDLWRYVDGDAERYVRAGVRRTVTGRYRAKEGGEALADLHEMSDAASSGRLLESEPAAGSAKCVVGDECRLYGQMLTFRQGRFFVRLTAYEDSPARREALVALARSIDNAISGRPSQ